MLFSLELKVKEQCWMSHVYVYIYELMCLSKTTSIIFQPNKQIRKVAHLSLQCTLRDSTQCFFVVLRERLPTPFFFLPESGLCKGQFIINTMVNTNSRTYCKRCLNTQLEVLFHWPCFYMCHCITYNVRSSHFASLLFFPSHTVQLIYPCTTPPP